MLVRWMKWCAVTASLAINACGGGDSDPETVKQWYLYGMENDSAVVSINLPRNGIYQGSGVLVAIVDNGLDLQHEDLVGNISWGNYSYLPEVYGFSDADHGTSVAGIIAAVSGNGVGGHGVAPAASLVVYNAMRAPATENIADALVRGLDRVSISNNSWGDFNSWGEPLQLKPQIEAALQKGTLYGRGGLGVIYVFSAGNGAAVDSSGIPSDNVNYSGLVNNKYTLPVCAVDEYGKKTVYSEMGATLLVCAPSRGSNGRFGIFTTDVTGGLGYNSDRNTDDLQNKSYTAFFGGTSAAAPMVSGVVALMLEANPGLSWRDVRYILASTARKNDSSDPGWAVNGAGFQVSHSYGFGLIDASAALKAAESWEKLPPSEDIDESKMIDVEIPDDDPAGLESTINVVQPLIVEFVDVFFDAPNHPRIGDLVVKLTSPSGTESILSELHNQVFGTFTYRNWRFGTLRHLGESAVGAWRLSVQDRRAGQTGSWKRWRVVVHGYHAG